MVEVTVTIELEGPEEIEEGRKVLEMIGQEVDDIQTMVKRPAGNIRISAFQKYDPAGNLLKIDPDSIIFSEEPCKLTGTDKQESILSEARNYPQNSIETVAETVETSASYTKHVLASATPEDLKEPKQESDDPWDIIGNDQSETSRVLDKPDTDTRQFEVLIELGTGSPATMTEVATRSEVGKSRVSSALGHLYNKKMIEAKKRRDVNYYYLSEEGEAHLYSEGYDVNSEHEEYRMMFKPIDA